MALSPDLISPDHPLRETPLHHLHVALGGRMVPFAGWSMPVQFPSGVVTEHHHCRNSAALFDVSHMGQLSISSPRGTGSVLAALEGAICADLVGLDVGQQRYGLLTADNGGILDDLMVTRRNDDVLVVVNASNVASDVAHLRVLLGDAVDVVHLAGWGLVALQGPKAVEVIRQLDPGVDELVFMQGAWLNLDGVECFTTRSGYTGEDGFEISVPALHAERLARRLLQFDVVAPAGLGARDTLRLEAGLCLHGNDISPSVTPIEAGLNWAIPKVRRVGGLRAGGYPGSTVVDSQLAGLVDRRRVGLVAAERVPVRDGAVITNGDGVQIGIVTSGTITPTVGQPIAMGFVTTPAAPIGSSVFALVRDRNVPMTVTALPFHPHRYVRRLANHLSTTTSMETT